ncbi:MAG: flagellar biosynthetic protein FliR [Methylohalobius sp.]|nr:flagellar biosynthetic protein FliR [Methylohalobius sp.]
MHWTEAQVLDFLARFWWPLLRIGALYLALPVFSSHAVPIRLRVILAVATVLAVMPVLPPLPKIEGIGLQAILLAVREVLIGIAIGSIVQLAFAALVLAGQNIAYSMGLGFASLLDPQAGVQVPMVSQLYLLFASLLFLGADGHLLLIELVAGSFKALPVGGSGFGREDLWSIVSWSSNVFAGGVLLSLPIVIALLFVNIALGIATRSAPQLNIFAVGFPITLGFGLVLIWLTFPVVLERFAGFLPAAYERIQTLLKV